jgi:hypothetical protein
METRSTYDNKKHKIPKDLATKYTAIYVFFCILGPGGLCLNFTMLASYAAAPSSNKPTWNQLVEACKRKISVRLKDPESIRVIEARGSTTQGVNSEGQRYDQSVLFRFTATNTYGGRVSGQATCEFYRGSLISNFMWE